MTFELHHPIEIDARTLPPLGMSPAEFFARYWQKQPVLIRHAFPDFVAPVDANDLAGLAMEEGALARLIRLDEATGEYRVQHAPLDESELRGLPDKNWTLLVQDCDKWFAEVGALLQNFRFIPRWRLDDVMISFATANAGVGAHIDQYDVFLLQGLGQRRWEIDVNPAAPKDFLPERDLKQLRSFTPSHQWVLNPGDMLYLPPNVPHNGVALNDCMTLSIGMRAPSVAELLMDFAETISEQLPDELRFTDATWQPNQSPGLLPDNAIESFRQLLRAQLDRNDGRFEQWLGGFLTRYRSALDAAPAEQSNTPPSVVHTLRQGAHIHLFPFARMCYTIENQATENHSEKGQAARVFFAGRSFLTSVDLADTLDRGGKPMDLEAFTQLLATDQQAICAMLDAGLLQLHGEDIA